ncbi:MAG: zinc ribbon domain-containing protein [Patescibacteria group bacterium]|nr:zinc ribbon domain-containing protein [Patescibacteria group bacterium]
MAKLKCKKCGHKYIEFGKWTDKFCKKCGNKLPEIILPPRCSNCDKLIDEESIFCASCGKKITDKKQKNGK